MSNPWSDLMDVVASLEALQRELRDARNAAQREIQEIEDTAIAEIKRIYEGTDVEPGVLSRLSASACMVTDAKKRKCQSVGEPLDKC